MTKRTLTDTEQAFFEAACAYVYARESRDGQSTTAHYKKASKAWRAMLRARQIEGDTRQQAARAVG